MWNDFRTAGGIVGWVAGDGPLLAVVLHGGPGLTDYTEGLAEEVLAGGDGRLRVARFQQRGQEPSVLDGPLTVDQFVTDIVGVVDHFGADTAVVAGHSWGGHLAMHVAAAAPERVEALLLIDSLGAVGDGGQSTMGPMIQARIGEAAVASLVEPSESDADPVATATRYLSIIWPGYFADPASAPPVPSIEWNPAVNAPLMEDANDQLARRVLELRLPAIAVPALCQIGRHSPLDPKANEETAALMPGAIVDVVDAGHFTWIEQPGCVTAATRRLLANR